METGFKQTHSSTTLDESYKFELMLKLLALKYEIVIYIQVIFFYGESFVLLTLTIQN